MSYRSAKNPVNGQPQIIVEGWENGMASSPHDGIADIRNAITNLIPGVVMCNYNLTLASASGSGTFTVNTGAGNYLQLGSTVYNLAIGAAIRVSNSGGALPSPLNSTTTYFISDFFVSSGNYFAQVSATAGGSSITLSTNGTGTQTFTTITPGVMTEYAVNPLTGYTYIGDSNGRVWSNETPLFYSPLSRTIDFSLIKELGTNAPVGGMAIFKNYLVVLTSGLMHCYGPLTTAIAGRAWTNLTINTALSGNGQHAKYFELNQFLYFCNGLLNSSDYQIGSLNELTGSTFDPTNPGTYNLNRKALLLPDIEIASWLEEQGGNLMIGTSTSNYVYPWDRVSVLFDSPIILPEAVTQKMININRVLYIFSGFRGNIYYTLGTTAQLLLSFPRVNLTPSQITETIFWGGVMSMSNHLIFGAQVNLGSATEYSGVFQINLNTGALVNPITGSIVMLNQNSSGLNSANTVLIPYSSPPVTGGGSIFLNETYGFNNGISYIAGWINAAGNSGGIDKLANQLATPSFYSNYETFVVSDIIPLGTAIQPITINQLEAKLDMPLVAGEKFRVSMRSNLNATFTPVFEQTATGAIDGFSTGIPIQSLKWIQLKCEMQTVYMGSFVRLKQLIIQL